METVCKGHHSLTALTSGSLSSSLSRFLSGFREFPRASSGGSPRAPTDESADCDEDRPARIFFDFLETLSGDLERYALLCATLLFVCDPDIRSPMLV